MQDVAERPQVRAALRSRPRRRLILQRVAVSAGIISLSIAIYPLLPRKYTAFASVQILPVRSTGVPEWAQSVVNAMDENAIQTKIDLLQSRPMQQRVIEANHLLDDPEFDGSIKPSFVRRLTSDYPLLQLWLPPPLDREDQVNRAVDDKLSILREHKSYLIHVGYKTAEAAKSVAMANSLVQSFAEDQAARRRSSFNAILNTLGDHVQQSERRYMVLNVVYRRFLTESGLDHVGEHEALLQETANLGRQIAEADQKVYDLTNRANLLQSQKGVALESASDVINSPLLQHLRQRYIELSTGTASTNSLPIGANNTILGVLRSATEMEIQRLVRAAQQDAELAQKNEQALRGQIMRVDDKLRRWEESEHEAEQYRRRMDAAKVELEQAQRALTQETEDATASLASRADVTVTMAVMPSRASFPDLRLYAAGTLLLLVVANGLLTLPRWLRRGR